MLEELLIKHLPDVSEISEKNEDGILSTNFKYKGSSFCLSVNGVDDPINRYLLLTTDDKVKFKNYPHVFKKKDTDLYWFCLIDYEQFVVSFLSFENFIGFHLEQFKSLLNLSKSQIREQNLAEFIVRWNNAAITFNIHFKIDVYLNNTDVPRQGSLKKKNDSSDFVYTDSNVINGSNLSMLSDVGEVVVLYIDNPQALGNMILEFPWNKDDILDLLYNSEQSIISEASYEFLSKMNVGKCMTFICLYKYPEDLRQVFSFGISFKSDQRDLFLEKIDSDIDMIFPYITTQFSPLYLRQRIGSDLKTEFESLVVGCGSVGSYIVDSLVHSGVTDIDISDIDNFESGNMLRHRLGQFAIGLNKADAMKIHYELNFPFVKVGSITKNVLYAPKAFFEKYDWIFICTGNVDLMRKFNFKLKTIAYGGKVIFTWLDTEGKGMHVLLISYSNKGDFESIITSSGNLIDSFCDGSERYIQNGCSGSFTAYGDDILLENTRIVMDVFKEYSRNEIDANKLFSTRFNKENLYTRLSLKTEIMELK